MKKPIELLAPAGSPDAYKAAVAAGADAVYLGGKGFNARQQAQNFNDEDLITVIDDAHTRGMKVYLVLNTLVGESEMKEAAALASFVYKEGIDGIIVQDLGLVHVLKEMLPALPIHASTQMTLHNIDGVKAAESLGIDRVVLSRELDLNEMSEIARHTNAELEVFVHGALCISRSGQCLMSSYIGGRSGNRGRCAQPCRLPWHLEGRKSCGDYLLSPRDLMALELIPNLIRAGVSSLKIEGRMKSPEYVAAVVAIYRKYLDRALENPAGYKVDRQDIQTLMQVFNRGGFTKGYLAGRNFKELMSAEHPKHWGVLTGVVEPAQGNTRSPFGTGDNDRLIKIKFQQETRMGDGLEIRDVKNSNPSAIISVMQQGKNHVKTAKPGETIFVGNFKSDAQPGSAVYKTYDKALMENLSVNIHKNVSRVPIEGEFHLFTGKNPVLEIQDGQGNRVQVEGDERTQMASNKPVTVERIQEQLSKTGDTPYYFNHVSVFTDNLSYIPVALINVMRRNALDKLSEKRRMSSKRTDTTKSQYNFAYFPGNNSLVAKKREISLYCMSVPEGVDWEGLKVERLYLPIKDVHITTSLRKQGIQGYLWTPAVMSDVQTEWYLKKIAQHQEQLDGVLVGNIGFAHRLREKYPGMPLALDFKMNLFNSWAIKTVEAYNPVSATLSVELNLDAISDIQSISVPLEAYVYGEIPVMTLEYCPGSNQGECDEKCGTCKNSTGHLTDRLGNRFLYKTDPFFRRSTIYNSKRLMLENVQPFIKSSVHMLRIGVMNESPDEIHEICRFYHEQWVEGLEDVVMKTEVLNKIKERGLTKGHYYRGVE